MTEIETLIQTKLTTHKLHARVSMSTLYLRVTQWVTWVLSSGGKEAGALTFR